MWCLLAVFGLLSVYSGIAWVADSDEDVPRAGQEVRGLTESICQRPVHDVLVVVAGPAREVRGDLDGTCARVRRVREDTSAAQVLQRKARRSRCVLFLRPDEPVQRWCYGDQPQAYLVFDEMDARAEERARRKKGYDWAHSGPHQDSLD